MRVNLEIFLKHNIRADEEWPTFCEWRFLKINYFNIYFRENIYFLIEALKWNPLSFFLVSKEMGHIIVFLLFCCI